MRGMNRHFLPFYALVLLISGCARYEFDITQPTEFASHVDTKNEVVSARPSLEYRWITVENRLVVKIYNQTDEPMQLVGDRSSVVDPEGQSHPLLSQSIAPKSFIKLILPPMRPYLENTGPTFGIGFGTYVGDGRCGRHGYLYDDWYDEPRYFIVFDDNALFWSWPGEGEVRLSLVFARKDETFTHEFVIRRVKM